MTSSPGCGVLQTTNDDRHQQALLVWPPNTTCRLASNSLLLQDGMSLAGKGSYFEFIGL